jgi:hypothetical protein
VEDFIYKVLAPAVVEMADLQCVAICLAVKRLVLSYDAAHDSVVEARHTRGVLMVANKGPHRGKVLRASSSKEGKSSARENPLLRTLMAWARDNGGDIVALCIDESSAQNIVRQAVREHAPNLLQPDGEPSAEAFDALPVAEQRVIAARFTQLVIDMSPPPP